MRDLEIKYKEPFSEIGAESLAGNLSNTIAGRICNYFDLKGGGYVLDGACSSSLLAVANACSALSVGDLDVALAGGVDLSLDPFELVGFAKAGALAQQEMRVYDAKSEGFIPGEGCGFMVLMRYEDALAQNCRIYSLIRGWGISSDGHGGITRPEVDGQLLALQRAYHKAGFGADTVAYFEGHGTGTAVGDATELQVLSQIRKRNAVLPAVVGSIKANIGHTKAAAGIAGLIKATLALHSQMIPPTSGSQIPHPLLTENPAVKTLQEGQLWPSSQPLRAGVSAMGFGGINTHIVLEGLASVPRTRVTPRESQLIAAPQDAELLLLSAQTLEQLQEQVRHLLTIAPQLSHAEVGDLAAQLAKTLDPSLPLRAAMIASNPQELTDHLEKISSLEQLPPLSRGVGGINLCPDLRVNCCDVFLGTAHKTPRVGFLFPGQAAPVYLNGGAWERRFPWLKEIYTQANLPREKDLKSTVIAQPAIITSAVVGLQVLEHLGITASIAVGHSLGELSALHWAGALNATSVINLARVRGQAMAENPTGMMASIAAPEQAVRQLLNGRVVVIASLNSPSQTVISGEVLGVNDVLEKAKVKGIKTVKLPVSHAFHSPLVSGAIQPLKEYLATIEISPLQKPVISTVTASFLSTHQDLRSLLVEQITAPVRFIDAATLAAKEVDLFIEVGSGEILSGLIGDFLSVPVMALDAGAKSLKGLLKAVAAAFVMGIPINHRALFEDRFTRPFNLHWQPKFLLNPCELAPSLSEKTVVSPNPSPEQTEKQKISATVSPLECIRQLVADKTELPLEAIRDDHRLLSDLHLNSITVGQLVAQAARHLGLSPPVSPTDYADATLAEIAQALENLASIGDVSKVEEIPTGVEAWIRIFSVEWVDTPLNHQLKDHSLSSNWQIIAPTDDPLIASLQQAFNLCEGSGVVVCLGPKRNFSDMDLLLEGCKKLLHSSNLEGKLVLVQHGGGAASFAKTFFLENPQITTCVVDVPVEVDPRQAAQWITSEAALGRGYCEAYYDPQGNRRSPVLRLLSLEDHPETISLDCKDVLLVTGGGKGIAAECALSLASDRGVRLALLGRSQPDTDPELEQNLSRIKALGIPVMYLSVDVTDPQGIKAAVSQIESQLGTITALIHAAGVNHPKLIKHLDKNDVLCTVAPKVVGLQNLLAAINADHLKVLITFGSIIARTGLPGEADYALANEWLGRDLEEFQHHYPHCRCLNLDWSVWSGVGMGQRLGRIESLIQQGITPIPPDTGISILRRLLNHRLPTPSVVVTGRFGTPPTLKIEQPPLPLLRFLEQPKVYYPGIELIVDVELSPQTDPYLNDHIYQGERIFPGVMGLEAMAQVATALISSWPGDSGDQITFEKVRFNRPIICEDQPLKIRIAAQRTENGQIEMALRSEQTQFSIDHFRAIYHVSSHHVRQKPTNHLSATECRQNSTPLNPQQHLYGQILFHQGRFQRLQQYQHLRATECIATLSRHQESWFSRYLPQDLILGDPGAKDAVIHALQACVPHATLLPVGIEKLIIYAFPSVETLIVAAQERQRIGDRFIYDLDVLTPDGMVLEHWEGLTLEIVQHRDSQIAWVANLLSPYLERKIKEVLPSADLRILVDQDETVDRRIRSDRSLQALTSKGVIITRRPDGKPEVNQKTSVSVAHAGNLTLAVAGSGAVACDVETVISRTTETWSDLLGTSKFALASALAASTGESLDVAALRVWAAYECLKKAGAMLNAPLMLSQTRADGVWLESGEMMIATFVISVQQQENPCIFAILVNHQDRKNEAFNQLEPAFSTPIELSLNF